MIQRISQYKTLFLFTIVTALFFSGCARERDISVKKIEKKDQSHVIKRQQTQPPPSVPEIQLQKKKKKEQLVKKSKITPIVPEIQVLQHKKVFEFVRVNGELYPVPLPWRGKKISEKSPVRADLQQIPVEFTHQQSILFVHKDACEAFVNMAEKAKEDGVELLAHSGYRSVWYQQKIFSKLMSQGRTWEDLVRYVAPPGYSEHATGMVVDLYPSNWQFANSDSYGWLKKNAADFGFSETYPEISSQGFPWEAWHWRFRKNTSEATGEIIASPE